MTPPPSAGGSTPSPRASGNPATQAKITLSVKEQRERARQLKLAEYQKQLAKRRRGKILWWVIGGTAAVIVAALVAASLIFTPSATPAASGSAAPIAGVQTYTNTANHVSGTVAYPQSPPAGGPHNSAWLNCGIYNVPQVNENAVHSLEHSAIWVTYDATKITGDQLAALKKQMPSTYAILSPYSGLDSPIVLSAWNHQLKIDSPSDPRITQFFTQYWQSPSAPEPGAPCTGGIDGPGKQ